MNTIQTVLQMSSSDMELSFNVDNEGVKIYSSADGIRALAKKFGLFECRVDDIQADFDESRGSFLFITLEDIK